MAQKAEYYCNLIRRGLSPLVSKISENLILHKVIGPGRPVSLATIFLSQPLGTSPPLSLYRERLIELPWQ